MNPYRTNDLWCKKCLWHRCRCELVKLCGDQLADFERMIPPTQYTRTMTMDDLRRNALESVIEDLKERDA